MAEEVRVRNVNINIRVTAKESRAFKKAAKADGLDFSTWMRLLAREASGMKITG